MAPAAAHALPIAPRDDTRFAALRVSLIDEGRQVETTLLTRM